MRARAKIIQVIRESLLELKQFIHQHEFSDQEEEIHFFKEIKPRFLSRYFYYDQLFSILIKTSLMDLRDKKKCYRKMLKRIRRFQKKNCNFYQYWLTKGTHLDDKYFTRREEIINDPIIDERFSSGYDIKVAIILANEELKKHSYNNLKKFETIKKHEPELKWTGSKAALVELIYALQTAGVFNHATSDVKQIATCFEELFDVNLGNFYDTFQQIKIRKGGQTRFLDLMKKKLSTRIETLDELN